MHAAVHVHDKAACGGDGRVNNHGSKQLRRFWPWDEDDLSEQKLAAGAGDRASIHLARQRFILFKKWRVQRVSKFRELRLKVHHWVCEMHSKNTNQEQ